MSFARVHAGQTTLLSAEPVTVEVDITSGSLNAFSIVGLPNKAVEESRDRIAAAIKNSGYTSPKASNQKTVISLAPADLKKEGALFELGMIMAYLKANDDIDFDPEGKLFLGEVALDGTLRPIRGTLPLVRMAHEHGFREVYVPHDNKEEAGLIDGVTVYPVHTVKDVVDHLDATADHALTPQPRTQVQHTQRTACVDFRDVRGQEHAKRALIIAGAGGHNVGLSGPPGAGKTMLSQALAGALPQLTYQEMLDVTSIHSVAGHLTSSVETCPPFRAPHHTASYVAIVGGGNIPKPGEITLAHKGVLFLDEFPEFDRRVVETLRQPLESREVVIARSGGTAHFPADIILVIAMNPCPCGNYGVEGKQCVCTQASLEKYRKKLSGPLVDRIDLWVDVPAVDHNVLLDKKASGPSSADICAQIASARKRQGLRAQKHKLAHARNSRLPARNIDIVTNLSQPAQQALSTAAEALDLSARSYHRVIKVARTIADLDGSDDITEDHIAEALQYRPRTISG